MELPSLDPHSPLYEPRWTSDELVLNAEEMTLLPLEDVAILTNEELIPMSTFLNTPVENVYGLVYGPIGQKVVLLLQYQPLTISLHRTTTGQDTWKLESTPFLKLNSQQLMHFEVRRFKSDATNANGATPETTQNDKDRHGDKEIVGYWEDGLAIYADGTREQKPSTHNLQEPPHDEQQVHPPEPTQPADTFVYDTTNLWEESFGAHVDSKPNGPMSLGMDVLFPNSKHLFGLPEHASSMQLLDTNGEGRHYEEPYRLYNLDVFEYELDETMVSFC